VPRVLQSGYRESLVDAALPRQLIDQDCEPSHGASYSCMPGVIQLPWTLSYAQLVYYSGCREHRLRVYHVSGGGRGRQRNERPAVLSSCRQ